MKMLYAVYDRVSQDVTGGVMVFAHDAPAIRIFADALSDASTILSKHPSDFDLVCLGDLYVPGDVTESGVTATDLRIEAFHGSRIVLSGAAWLAQRDAEAAK